MSRSRDSFPQTDNFFESGVVNLQSIGLSLSALWDLRLVAGTCFRSLERSLFSLLESREWFQLKKQLFYAWSGQTEHARKMNRHLTPKTAVQHWVIQNLIYEYT